MTYALHIATMIALYAIAATGLNLLAGYAGLVSMAHAALLGCGAYCVAVLTLRCGWGLLPSMLGAVAFGAVAGAALAVATRRSRGDYFVLMTLAFQLIAFDLFNNWTDLTGGPLGLAGIPGLRVTEGVLASRAVVASSVWAVALAVAVIASRLVHAPLGRVMLAVREDELLAQALGKDVPGTRVAISAVSAALAALAGAIYASYTRFIDPTSFTITESIFLISVLIVGGAGTVWGPFVGAAALVVLPEGLRFLDLPTAAAANLRQILYGAVLVLMMLVRPRGLVGKYGFER